MGAFSLACNKTEVKELRYSTLKTSNPLLRYNSEEYTLPGARVNCVKEARSSSKLHEGLNSPELQKTGKYPVLCAVPVRNKR